MSVIAKPPKHGTTFSTSPSQMWKDAKDHAEKVMDRAAADGVITKDERDGIMRELGNGQTRDYYLKYAGKLAATAQPPIGLDALIERMERRDAAMDAMDRWNETCWTASRDGEFSSGDREQLVREFEMLGQRERNVLIAGLPYSFGRTLGFDELYNALLSAKYRLDEVRAQ